MTTGIKCKERQCKEQYLKYIEEHRCIACGRKVENPKSIRCDVCQIKTHISSLSCKINNIERMFRNWIVRKPHNQLK